MTVHSWARKLFARTPHRASGGPRKAPARRLQLEALEDRLVPAVHTVLNLNPSGAGSLSAVLAAASAGDTIVFAHHLRGIITPAGTLTVANNVTIRGPGSDVVSISGGKAHQVFVINSGVNATLSGLTITNGFLATDPDPNLNLFGGGAIDNEGNLALLNCVVSNSTAAGEFVEGGGIFSNSDSSLSLVNCLVAGNTAATDGIAEGGGITSFGSLSLVNCLVAGNTATGTSLGRGGGIASFGQVLSVSGCTITGNQATSDEGETQGGGIVDLSTTGSIVNTVFTTNTVSTTSGAGAGAEGGGYFNIGNSITTMTDVTFRGNTAINGGTGAAEGGGFAYLGQLGTFTNVNVIGNTASSTGDFFVVGGGASLRAPVNWTGGLVSGNTATCSGSGPGLGGGIWAGDQSTLTGLTVIGNTASNTGTGKAEGGGLDVQRFTTLIACTVSGNHATANSGIAEGGGIVSFGNLMVTASTIANNRASSSTGDAQGGGIWSNPIAVENGALTVTNATLFGNSVRAPAGTASGGGLFNLGGATLFNDTLASNTATGATALGGGISNSAAVNLVNTIVYDPNGAATDQDVSGPITASQHSLFGSNVAAQIAANGDLGGNQFGVNPLLGPLQFNGGPTQTMALRVGSPALGTGTNISPLGGLPTTDQRGLPRPGPDGFDLGAFQTQRHKKPSRHKPVTVHVQQFVPRG